MTSLRDACGWPRSVTAATVVLAALAVSATTIWRIRAAQTIGDIDPVAVFAAIAVPLILAAGLMAVVTTGLCALRLHEAWRSTIEIEGEGAP